MKKIFISIIIIMLLACSAQTTKAQEYELQQLALNLEKLNQFRAILDNMYKGYKILSTGYQTIKDLAEGNFDLHKVFLDGLMMVSPTVKKYKKITDIITYQRQLVKEYKTHYQRFQEWKVFQTKEIGYLHNVYENLIDRSLKSLDELVMIITSGQLRMNDAERLIAIDRIAQDMQDKLQFLRHFNSKTTLLVAQRNKLKQELDNLGTLYGIKN